MGALQGRKIDKNKSPSACVISLTDQMHLCLDEKKQATREWGKSQLTVCFAILSGCLGWRFILSLPRNSTSDRKLSPAAVDLLELRRKRQRGRRWLKTGRGDSRRITTPESGREIHLITIKTRDLFWGSSPNNEKHFSRFGHQTRAVWSWNVSHKTTATTWPVSQAGERPNVRKLFS